MIIKIDRSSVTKNPNAGSTSFVVMGAQEITFSFKGDFPDYLTDGENCFVKTAVHSPLGDSYECYLNDHSLLEKLLADVKMSVNINKNNQVIHHLPEPKYLFKYEQKNVQCSECKQMVPYNLIVRDSFDDDEWNYHSLCPKCNKYDTFPEIEYESIDDVLKELKITK